MCLLRKFIVEKPWKSGRVVYDDCLESIGGNTECDDTIQLMQYGGLVTQPFVEKEFIVLEAK